MRTQPRNPLSATIRAQLRQRFGIWVLYEWRNRARYAIDVVRLRRFENQEVLRLSAGMESAAAEVAVVMPTFRRPDGLVTAVQAVLDQSYRDLVLVVVDDGGGLPVLPADPRIHAVQLSRNTAVLGLVRNVGMRLTRSRYIAFLDDDNQWTPDHLQRAVQELESGQDLIYTGVTRRLPDGSVLDVLSEEFDRRALSDRGYIDANSVVLRRQAGLLFSRIPRTRATLPKEDWEFVYRASRGRRVRHVPVATVEYFVNPASYYTNWTHQDADD